MPHGCREPLGSELFSSAVLPFKKTIGNEEHDITGFQDEFDRYRVPQIRGCCVDLLEVAIKSRSGDPTRFSAAFGDGDCRQGVGGPGF